MTLEQKLELARTLVILKQELYQIQLFIIRRQSAFLKRDYIENGSSEGAEIIGSFMYAIEDAIEDIKDIMDEFYENAEFKEKFYKE